MPTEMFDEDEVEEARTDGYDKGYEDGKAGRKKGDGKEFNGPMLPMFHFHVHPDDLAQALLNGTIVSRSVNGAGSPTDAREQAEHMLAACGMLK